MTLANGDTDALIRAAIDELSADEARNPSHVLARILRRAIRKGLVLDELHLGDVLIASNNTSPSIFQRLLSIRRNHLRQKLRRRLVVGNAPPIDDVASQQ